MNQDMQLHPIEELESGKEIHCQDCGFVYWTARAEISSTCSQCGNIAYHPGFTDAANERLRKQNERLMRGPLVPDPTSQVHHEISKQGDLQANQIEEIAIQYQQEWQLWSFVVRNFADPHAHLAYLSFLTRNLAFATGTKRYTEIRSHYLPLPGEKWRVAKADAMLDQIQGLCQVQFQRSLSSEPHRTIPVVPLYVAICRRVTLGLLYFAVGALFFGAFWLLIGRHV